MEQDATVTENAMTDKAAVQALAARGYRLVPYEHDGATSIRLFYGDLKVCTASNAVCAWEFVEMTEKLPRKGSPSAEPSVH